MYEEKGKVSKDKWKEILYIGLLKEFIVEHSRLKIA